MPEKPQSQSLAVLIDARLAEKGSAGQFNYLLHNIN